VNVFMPARVVDAPMHRTAYYVGFAVLLALGIAVGLAHARARTLTRGLRRMRDAFEALRGPGRSGVAQPSGISEIDAALLVAAETAQELDLTERRLRQSEEQFRMIAHAAPAVVWVAVPSGDIVFINARWHEYTGQTEEQARGFGWTSATHPDDLVRLLPQWERCRTTGDVYEGECRYRRRDGQYRWHAFRALPNRGADQTIDRWFGCSIEIHDAWEARAALQEADRRKDEFLATLAHELRNPLAPVRNAVQLLKLSSADDPAVQMAQEVLDRQVGHMVRLIDDLLDVGRITRGKLNLRRQPVELRRVIEQAAETSRPHIRQQFDVHLPPEPIYLDADPVRLAQVFSNLLNNAAKYTDGSGHIVLSAAAEGDAVRISVADSGIGIAPEQLAHVFEMFAQARPALARAEGGLGIGLSLCRSLVELHGGTISAHSGGLGHGAEFVVRLPLLAAPRIGEGAQKPVVAYSGAIRRVLVVDDTPDSVRTLAALLRADGNQVETAADGMEALEKAHAFKPDIVLLDLGLPKMNGYDVCRSIRQQPWGRGIFIVAVTGWGQSDDRSRTRAAGFNDHLVKPIDYEVVRKLLASALAT
jgi:PAS domain S-box-containing protein